MNTQARKPPPGRGALIYRLLRPRQSTVLNQIAVTRQMTQLLRTRADRGETAALRRELEELRRRVGGLTGRAGLDSAIRRAVEEYQRRHPLPSAKPARRGTETRERAAPWLVLLPTRGGGTVLLRTPAKTAPALRLALRRWVRPEAEQSASPSPLLHRRLAPERGRTRGAEEGEPVLAAQQARPAPAKAPRTESVTRAEVERMLRDLPPPDLGELTERVTRRLERTLRAERRRAGRGG